MTWIPDPIPPHKCKLPDADSPGKPTRWRCDDDGDDGYPCGLTWNRNKVHQYGDTWWEWRRT